MKEQRRFGLALSWPRITAVFLIDVAVLTLASHAPKAWQTNHIAWWVGVGIAALVSIVALITYRRVTIASALAARVLDRFSDPEAMLTAGRTPAIDHQRRFGRDKVGIRTYHGRLVGVIAVEDRGEAQSGRHRHPGVSAATLAVEAVAARLRQYDVRLDGIDIVSVGTQRADGADSDAFWPDVPVSTNGHPAIGRRTTWLVVRMDPQRNVAAVAARDSLASTLAGAVERLARDLDGRGCTARPVTADEFAAVDTAVLAGLQPAHIRSRRRRLKHEEPQGPKEFVTSFWVSPRDITSETLDRLWLQDTDATAVTVRLRPRRGRVEVSAWVRYHSGARLPKDAWAGLNRLTGRQLVAVCASLPVPAVRSPLVVPGRELRDHEQLWVPLNRTPQDAMTLLEA